MKWGRRALVGWMVSMFWVFLAVVSIIGIMAIDSTLLRKQVAVEELSGDRVLALFGAQERVQRALVFVDLAAQLVVPDAIRDVGLNGGFVVSPCGSIDSAGKKVALWENGAKKCYAQNSDVRDALRTALNRRMDPVLEKYPPEEAVFAKQNYDIMVNGKKVYGVSRMKVRSDLFGKGNELVGSYSFAPSFAVGIGGDISADFSVVRSQADAARALWVECMKRGSSTSSDADDAMTCVQSAGSVVKDARFDEVKMQYVVFLEVPLESFRNSPVVFALSMRDDFPPPSVEGVHLLSEDGSRFLVWEKNPASDVAIYEVFVSSQDFTLVEDSMRIGTTKDLRMAIADLPSGQYHAAVVAVDERGNRNPVVRTLEFSVS